MLDGGNEGQWEISLQVQWNYRKNEENSEVNLYEQFSKEAHLREIRPSTYLAIGDMPKPTIRWRTSETTLKGERTDREG